MRLKTQLLKWPNALFHRVFGHFKSWILNHNKAHRDLYADLRQKHPGVPSALLHTASQSVEQADVNPPNVTTLAG